METVYSDDKTKSIMFNELGSGLMVQSNQHIIIKNDEAMVLDPGGHKVYTQLFAQLSSIVPISKIKYVFFSHQDPDIIAAANGWLMVTDAQAYISSIWLRFLPHFGIDKFLEDRLNSIQDEGMTLNLGGTELLIIPAHFLHSAGNFVVYDPDTKILYSGDFGASLGGDYAFVDNFQEHIQYIELFHTRYIPSSKPIKMLLNTLKELDIEILAPQHGAVYKGKQVIGEFFDWLGSIKTGYENMGDKYNLPGSV